MITAAAETVCAPGTRLLTRLLTRLSPTAEHRPPTGSYSPLRRRAVPAGGESARRRLRLRHFPEGLGPRWLRAVRVRERSGKGGSRRYLERHPALHVRTAAGHAPAPLKGAARPTGRPSPGGWAVLVLLWRAAQNAATRPRLSF